MSATPATLTINFVANYAGPHRVCYRIGNSGPYTCVITACTGGPCSQDISVTVDNETCPTVNINGYVQPACEDIASTTNRVPFSYDFIPNPSCKRYTVTCTSVGLASITLTSGASGYNPASPPIVLISGGGGSGATATANVSGGGVITSITLNTVGSGYTSAPAITIAPSGTGQVATATAVLGKCTELSAPGCSGSPGLIPTVFGVGEGTSICSITSPTIPTGFSSVDNGNCACNCVTTTIVVTGDVGATIQYYYNKCNGDFTTGFLAVGSSPSSINDCVVSGSVVTRVISGNAVAGITYGSSCP